LQLYDPMGIIEEFDKSIHREMDFLLEARNIERFRRNFRTSSFLVVPRVFWDYTTESVLTMEYLRGKKFSELMDEGISQELRQKITREGSKVLLDQIFEHGFFHADPHPGNILLLPDGRLALLDYGMMGNIDPDLREALSDFLYGITKKDIDLIVRKLRDITHFPEDLDERRLKIDLADFIDRYYDIPIRQLTFDQLTNDLLAISRSHRIAIPADFVLLLRALVISEGLIRQLDPDFNLIEQVRPIAMRLFLSKYDPVRKLRHMLTFLEESEELLRQLPTDIQRILQKMKAGEVTVRFQHENLEELVSEMESTSTRLSFSLIIGAIIVGSALIILADKGPKFLGVSVLGLLGFLLAGVMGFWLVIQILRSGRLHS
jgi:ubiquinone biosynthesis protein